MSTLRISSGNVRAELVASEHGISVTVYRTPNLGSARFAHQMATKPRVMTTGRAVEERLAHQNVSAHDPKGPEVVRNVLSRNSLRLLNRADQAKLDALLGTVFGQEASHARR